MTQRVEDGRGADCPLLFVQQGRNEFDLPAPDGFEEVWRGTRRGDGSEQFVLYRKSAS